MIEADRVLSTPPLNTPIDTNRRRLLAVTAGASVASVGTLAVAAAVPAAPDSAASAVDPAFALIAAKLAADRAHCEAIDEQDAAEDKDGIHSNAAFEAAEHCGAAGNAVNAIDWRLATTPPTTLAGVAAVLRFANEVEDAGNEWPDTDTIGREGWHYQLRATMAAALEAIIRREAQS